MTEQNGKGLNWHRPQSQNVHGYSVFLHFVTERKIEYWKSLMLSFLYPVQN